LQGRPVPWNCLVRAVGTKKKIPEMIHIGSHLSLNAVLFVT
jgi:hypothetical protein